MDFKKKIEVKLLPMLSGKVILDRKRKKLKVAEITALSSDTKLIRLRFPGANDTLGLPVGKHFKSTYRL